MRLILDSQVVIWAADNVKQLSQAAGAAVQDQTNERFVSAATIWEIAIKVGLGKLHLSLPYHQWMNQVIADLALAILPITVDYVGVQATLPRHHGDPFDRLLVAQALVEKMSIVSVDKLLDIYGVKRIW